MNSRERMLAACHFRAPDKVPVEYYYAPVGFYEHGERLNDLYEAHPGDFAPYVRQPIPVPGPECFDENGRYHEIRTDAWGTAWEYRIFGIAIHTDRGGTMTYGSPDDVRALVRKEYEIFRPDKGGSWFYIEPDNGMPFENIRALIEQVYEYR